MSDEAALALAHLSRRLQRLRQEAGLRLSDLARLTELSQAYLYRVEVGERLPSLPSLIRLGKAYNVSAAELLEEPGDTPPSVQHSGAAVWCGSESAGDGVMIDAHGSKTPYDVESRLADTKPGASSPEEHIGMAIAGCFSMSLAQELEVAGFDCVRIETTANVSLNTSPGELEIEGIALRSEIEVSGISARQLEAIAQHTKRTCVIARALAAVPVTLQIEHHPLRELAA